MKLYRNFLQSVAETYSAASCREIVSALRLASFELRHHKRYDDSPMILHAVGVAQIICCEIGLGRNSVIASLLHDVARLGILTEHRITQLYGKSVSDILRGMNSISAVDAKTSSLQVDNFRELIVSYSSDPRVILIKMADRLEVMRSLSMFPELKRNKKSWETLHLYAQLAHKLGLYNIKSEMEDLALAHLEEKEYKHIERRLEETAEQRKAFITQFVAPIEEKLRMLGVRYQLKSRTKSIYSIWRKMKKQRVQFDEVFDIFAIRIIIECPADLEKVQCWTVFSVVTDFYTPNPDRMRDWISIPKSNGYESLHATVVTSEGRWVEVQIRTERMDELAERGVAAHWRYKGVSGGGLSTDEWLSKLRGIVENTATSDSISEEFDISLNMNEVFVFTPNGDLRKLPEGATLLDFAFDIHSNLGALCTGGRINGRKVPIRERLHSGDIVEITTSKGQRPKADWLNVVVTNKAKSKIRQILREEQASSANLGREELERKIKNWKMPLSIEEAVTLLTKHYKVKTGFEVYSMIAEQRVPMAEIKEYLMAFVNGEIIATEAKPRKESVQKPIETDLVINDTVKGLDFKLGKCCNPIFGDDVFGFVTVNSGITIHRTDCPNAARLSEKYPYRKVAASWGGSAAGGSFRALLRITGDESPGFVGMITDIITHQLKINIRSMSFNTLNGQVEGTLAIEVPNASIVDMVIYNLKKMNGVRVKRLK